MRGSQICWPVSGKNLPVLVIPWTEEEREVEGVATGEVVKAEVEARRARKARRHFILGFRGRGGGGFCGGKRLGGD